MNPITSKPQPTKEPVPTLLYGGPWDKQSKIFGTLTTLPITLLGWKGAYHVAAGNPYAAYWESTK